MSTDEKDMEKELTWKQKDMIAQVEATMRIENMPIDAETHQNLIDIVSGKKTADQVIKELDEKYNNR